MLKRDNATLCCEMNKPPLDYISHQVAVALAEDIGEGDISADLVDAQQSASALVISREDAVLCGTDWFNQSFHQVNRDTVICWDAHDGDRVTPNQQICTITGQARSLLSAERTALNFLQTLSGVATKAAAYARAAAGSSTRILDTRKTIPGLRLAQKYAVAIGGCNNHRNGLYDAFLIKENHITSSETIESILACAGAKARDKLLEIEIEHISQLEQAIAGKADRIMLDNFTIEDIGKAVEQADGRVALEVSGNIETARLAELIATGVDYISVGALTKHLRAIDFSMRFL